MLRLKKAGPAQVSHFEGFVPYLEGKCGAGQSTTSAAGVRLDHPKHDLKFRVSIKKRKEWQCGDVFPSSSSFAFMCMVISPFWGGRFHVFKEVSSFSARPWWESWF